MIYVTIESPHADDRLLSDGDLAAYVRVPQATVKYWAREGTGPAHFRAGRYRRYVWRDVVAWIEGLKEIAAGRQK